MFAHPFSFKGRARRLEFFLSYLIFCLPQTFIMTINQSPGSANYGLLWSLFQLLAYFSSYWFIFATGARRCHDIGWNGWVQLIPFVGIVLLFCPGDKGENKYGSSPKK